MVSGSSRRLRLKDGRELNLWNEPHTMEEVQSLGYTSHADPEIGILYFDGENGAPLAVLWHFACHTNANFGPRFSADYPAVAARILQDRYPGVASIFLPGACGDVNPVMGWREIGITMVENGGIRHHTRHPRGLATEATPDTLLRESAGCLR